MQKEQKYFYSKECAIASLIEQSNETKRNLYLKFVIYGNNQKEYIVTNPEEVMCYSSEYFIGHYLFHSHSWVCFNPEDRVNITQVDARKRIIIPEFQIERPGIFE